MNGSSMTSPTQEKPTPTPVQTGAMSSMTSLTERQAEPIHWSDSETHANHSIFGPGGLLRKAFIALFWAVVYCVLIFIAGFALWWIDNEYTITTRISTWWTRQQLAKRKKEMGPDDMDDEEELMNMADGNGNVNSRRRKMAGD